MLFTRRFALLFTLGWMLLTSPVSASGPPNGRFVFTNETAGQIGVTTAATSAPIVAALGPPFNLTNFTAAGGVVLNPSASYTFTVLQGTYTIGAIDLTTTSTGAVASFITESQHITAGFTDNVYIKPNTSPPPTIMFSSTP